MKWQFYLSFWRSNLISCEMVRRKHEIAILPQFLAIEPHFARNGCARKHEIAILLQNSVFGDRTSFRAKRLRLDTRNRNFTSVFGDGTSFRAKGLRLDARNRNFTSAFGDRTSFRAKGLRFVPSHWHCPAPSREKWKRRSEQEGKRARGQESKRARENVKM